MNDSPFAKHQAITPEGIAKLEQLKSELETLTQAMQSMEGKSKYEIEGTVRAFQDKEGEVRQFLQQLGLMPEG
ncbi:MAG: hypothetical protein HQL52_12410 [Magnetococcales bacterium]|nr:hypothetical protein [Magnetococcales bacterium]